MQRSHHVVAQRKHCPTCCTQGSKYLAHLAMTRYQGRGMRRLRTPSQWTTVRSGLPLIPRACRDTDGPNESSQALIFSPIG